MTAETISHEVSLQKAKPLESFEALEFEKEVLGFYLSGHPLTPRRRELIAYSNYRLDNLPTPKEDINIKDAQIVRVAGMISSVKKLISKTKKEPYAKFKIEDLYGNVEAILFPKSFEKYQEYLTPNNVVVVKGRLMGSEGQAEIIVEEMMTIDEAKTKFQPNCGKVHIKLSTTRFDDALKKELDKLFEKYKGKAKVYIDLEDPISGNYLLETPYLSDCSDSFIDDIEKVIGSQDIVELHYTN